MAYDDRGLDKNLIMELSAYQYINQHRGIVLQDPTGPRKNFLDYTL